jgi:RNA polymerase primary sigma factor
MEMETTTNLAFPATPASSASTLRRDAILELVESNIGLVVNIATRYRSRRLPLEDLVNEGILGLIRAACEFDPERGSPFASIAGCWIRKHIWEALSRERFTVHVPACQARKMLRLRWVVRALTEALGRPPRREEIAGEEASQASAVDVAFRDWPKEQRLDRAPEGSRPNLLKILADPYALSPEDALLLKERRKIIQGAVAELTVLEQVVISHRFGLETEEPLTLGRIGEMCGLTRQRILQIEARAKERLRKTMQRKGWIPARQGRTTGRRACRPSGGGPRRLAVADEGEPR